MLEDLVQSKLEARGWHCTHVEGRFKYWDFAISKAGMVSKVEVKHDYLSEKTGNFCIELNWLQHTLASILIIGTPLEAWMISVDEVKKIVQDYTPRQTGDSPTNLSVLIPKQVLISKATRFI